MIDSANAASAARIAKTVSAAPSGSETIQKSTRITTTTPMARFTR